MLIPYGTVVAYAGKIFEEEKRLPLPDFSPTPLNTTGWLLCNGDEILQSMFPGLFEVIEDIYGGDKSTGKVNLPNYEGYFLRGLTKDSKRDPGLSERKAASEKGKPKGVGSTQHWMVQKHSHMYTNYPPDGAGLPIVSGGPAENPENYTTGLYEDDATHQPLSGDETRPQNMYVYFIIHAGLPVR